VKRPNRTEKRPNITQACLLGLGAANHNPRGAVDQTLAVGHTNV
jgi:hypothetical protein